MLNSHLVQTFSGFVRRNRELSEFARSFLPSGFLVRAVLISEIPCAFGQAEISFSSSRGASSHFNLYPRRNCVCPSAMARPHNLCHNQIDSGTNPSEHPARFQGTPLGSRG